MRGGAVGTFAAIGGVVGVAVGAITGDWGTWVVAGGALGVGVGFAMDYFRGDDADS